MVISPNYPTSQKAGNALTRCFRCSVPECEDNPDHINFTIPHDSDGIPSKCLRYAPFSNVSSFYSNDSQCYPHYYDTSTEIGCESYVYLEEHSIVKEIEYELT
uniref:SFRICE_033990 n=1 Tax=Spodoptera frugiperda TaxID=7108 RepID=A0A2H1WVY4_SPOFR